jgi:hypothetical protein
MTPHGRINVFEERFMLKKRMLAGVASLIMMSGPLYAGVMDYTQVEAGVERLVLIELTAQYTLGRDIYGGREQYHLKVKVDATMEGENPTGFANANWAITYSPNNLDGPGKNQVASQSAVFSKPISAEIIPHPSRSYLDVLRVEFEHNFARVYSSQGGIVEAGEPQDSDAGIPSGMEVWLLQGTWDIFQVRLMGWNINGEPVTARIIMTGADLTPKSRVTEF